MHSEAEVIVEVAHRMIASHGTNACRRARMHARNLHNEPRRPLDGVLSPILSL